MKVTAYYMTKRGAGCVRLVHNAEEAEKILRGGYGATTARLETANGGIVGMRFRESDAGKMRWFWFYDKDYFK